MVGGKEMSGLATANFAEYVESEMRLDKAAIDRLKRRYPGWEFLPVSGQQKPPIVVSSNGSQAVEPLAQAVERIIKSLPSHEWTSAGIYAVLAAEKYPLPEPKAQRMANISTALGKLSKKPSSSVREVFKGSGRNPNRYQWRDIP
jgi:hypothetical protein